MIKLADKKSLKKVYVVSYIDSDNIFYPIITTFASKELAEIDYEGYQKSMQNMDEGYKSVQLASEELSTYKAEVWEITDSNNKKYKVSFRLEEQLVSFR